MESRLRARLVENATNHCNSGVRNHEVASVSGEVRACDSCSQRLGSRLEIAGNLDAFPDGVKFEPTDEELLHHLRAQTGHGSTKPHPLISNFISVLSGEDGICGVHPKHLPDMKKDGSSKHFFHRPAKAYTTGTRKRRKIHSEDDEPGVETRWHKTGRTRKVSENGQTLGWKKIMVLYRNTGAKKSKPEKTNWILHQYHLGETEEETDGELVVCKVFYQKQPRQCSTGGRQADDFNEMENVDLNQGSKEHSVTGISELSRRTPVTPKVDKPLRPRSSRGDATGKMRGQMVPQSSKGSELTVIGMEGPAPVASELTSTELQAVTPAGTSFPNGGPVFPPRVNALQPTVHAEGYSGDWNGVYEEESCQNESDNQVGVGIGSFEREPDVPHQIEPIFGGESQQQFQDDDAGQLMCNEAMADVMDFPCDFSSWDDLVFSNPNEDYPDLTGSLPFLDSDFLLSSQEVNGIMMDYGKVPCTNLDNDDSLSST